MTRKTFASLFAVTLVACGGSPAPEPAPPPAPPPPAVSDPAPVASEPAPAPEPTPEELKKAEDLKKLEADRAKMKADHEAELKRWTDELKAEAKALAERKYPNARVAIQTILKGKHRKPSHAERDAARRPLQTLEFFGIKPNMTVLEYGPGEGWYTEILAPMLAQQGKLIATTSDPKGPPHERATFYGERFQLFLDKSPELYGKIEMVTTDSKNPKLPLEGNVDLALVIRALHGMHNNKVLDGWLAEFHQALKPKGVLGIVQHRAKADANPDESSKKGYLPEKFVIERIEAAGFKLAGKSEINKNPKDTADHPEGVWSLPPTLREGDKDREKYVAIGESDRMTLKFVKVEKPAAK